MEKSSIETQLLWVVHFFLLQMFHIQIAVNEATNSKQTKRVEEAKPPKAETEQVVEGVSQSMAKIQLNTDPDSNSIKWGNDCLSVIPDSWLEEELERRKASRSLQASNSASEPAGISPQVSENPNKQFFIKPANEVKLCNTGKCEMFD